MRSKAKQRRNASVLLLAHLHREPFFEGSALDLILSTFNYTSARLQRSNLFRISHVFCHGRYAFRVVLKYITLNYKSPGRHLEMAVLVAKRSTTVVNSLERR